MTTQSNGSNLLVQGRILWTMGTNIFEGKQLLDFDTKAVKFDLQGNPIYEYGFGLAIAKTDPATGQPHPEFTKVWEALHAEAFTLYPSGQLPPTFAMKYKDGDTIDHQGKPFADREGYAGHIVLACTTRIPIKYFRFEGGQNVMVNDGIKCGDYVNVQLNLKSHLAKGQGKAGLYLNPSACQLIQAGKEIINTPSGDAIFSQAAPVFQGVVEAPVAPVAMPQVGADPVAPIAPVAPVGVCSCCACSCSSLWSFTCYSSTSCSSCSVSCSCCSSSTCCSSWITSSSCCTSY